MELEWEEWPKETKTRIFLLRIKVMDEEVEERTFSSEECRQNSYDLEEELKKIYEAVELMWQRRGGETLLLKGDTST